MDGPELERDARSRILGATIELIEEGERVADLTVRRIAERAAVGIGLINYHFGTKDELIQESVRIAIAEAIARWHQAIGPAPRTAEGRLRKMLKATARFLVEHPALSRLSIEHDLQHPCADDNTSATLAGLLPVLRDVLGAKLSEGELRAAALQLVAPLQVAFLRGVAARPLVGVDLHDAAARDAFVDRLIDRILHRTAGRLP